jgi:tetratricopeptide (TPR) repeat protein
MEAITVIALNKSNKIESTIQSVLNLNPKQILIGTYTPIKLKWEVVEFQNNNNYSADLNKLVELAKSDWIFYIKDNEVILQADDLSCLDTNAIYGVQVLQDDIIIKEPRLWNKKNKINFKNPVFEKLNARPNKFLDIILYQDKTNDDKAIKILESWKRSSPLALDPYYYKAFYALGTKDFKEFKSLITHYLFNSKINDVSCVIARYYLALVQGLVDKETDKAINNLVLCIAENPLMAEFWCLLGDIFTQTQNFEKAVIFYQNAIMLGSRRLKLDEWPMHISKYHDYPTEMIEKCNKITSSSKQYTITPD